MAVGVLGCMATLIVEAALIANFIPSNNQNALQAAVAMFFVFQVFYGACCDGMCSPSFHRPLPRFLHQQRLLTANTGTQFAYLGEIFPTHLRAKGVCLGVAMISFMNIIWLQAAPTAFVRIGWKFYLCFIIPGTIGGACMWLFWPDTRGLPLEEVAAIFGDQAEVAVYMAEIEIDRNTRSVVLHHADGEGKEAEIEGSAVRVENLGDEKGDAGERV